MGRGNTSCLTSLKFLLLAGTRTGKEQDTAGGKDVLSPELGTGQGVELRFGIQE